MKKIIDLIKKHDNVFIILLILFAITGIVLYVRVTAADELWCFQNIYKMYNGYEIYKDANVICTPLFFYLGEIVFKLFGANLLVFRMYHIFIMTLFFYFTYRILKKLCFRKKVAAIIVLFIITYSFYALVLLQANYNLLAMTFIVIGVYSLLNEENAKNKYKSIMIQGIILFLIFSTKQNVGIFYGLGLLVVTLIREEKVKVKIKRILIEFGIAFVLTGIGIIILYYHGIFNDFLNYAILGLKEFSSENRFISYSHIIILLFFIIINPVISAILIKNKRVNKKEKQNLIILNTFSIFLSFIIYPIINEAHFLMGTYLLFILFAYLCKFIISEIRINDKIFNYVLCIFSGISIIYSSICFVNWAKIILAEDYFYDYQDPYYGGIVSEDLKKHIDSIIGYINEKEEKVIVVSYRAALYMVPLKESNGYIDLPLKGNFGKDGEDGFITRLKQMDNVLVMIEKNEEDLMWQESAKIRDYIMNHFDKVDEIENFMVYKIKS